MADDSKYKIKFTADFKEVMAAIKKIQAEQKRSMALSRQAQKFQKGVDKGQIGEHKALVKTNALRLKGISDEKRAESARLNVAKQSLRQIRNVDKIKANSKGDKKGLLGLSAGGAAGLYVASKVAGAVIDFVRGGIESTYGKYQQFAVARGQNIGLGTPEEVMSGLDASNSTGKKLGFGPIEAAGMQGAMGRATGSLDPTMMMQMMRASGMTSGQTAGLFGTMRQGGTQFGAGGTANKELSKVLALGQSTGLEQARVPEYLESIQNLMQQEMANSAKDVKSSGIAQLMSQLMKSSGLAPNRAAGLLGQVSNIFTNPGGGETGMALVRRAMGFGQPGSNTSFYDAEKRREQALKDPQNFMRLAKQIAGETHGGEEGAFAFRGLGVNSLENAEAIQEMAKKGELSDEDNKKMLKIMEEAKPIDEQALTFSKTIADELNQIAKLEGRAIEKGNEFAEGIHDVEDILVDIRDFLLAYVKPVANFFTGGAGDRNRAKRIDEILKEPLTDTGTPEGNAREIAKRRKLIRERAEIGGKEHTWNVYGKESADAEEMKKIAFEASTGISSEEAAFNEEIKRMANPQKTNGVPPSGGIVSTIQDVLSNKLDAVVEAIKQQTEQKQSFNVNMSMPDGTSTQSSVPSMGNRQ